MVAREMAGAPNLSAEYGSYQQARRIQGLATQLCRDYGIRVVVEGCPPNTPAIFVANHVSHLDPLVIATITPLLPIAKGEISKWPFVGRVGHYLGIMFVKRDSVVSGARALRQSKHALQQGVSILNFPEGTTTSGEQVLPFKRGIFGLAAIARVPVIPAAIRFEPEGMAWVGDAYFVPHCLRTFARRRWTAYVSFAQALHGHQEINAGQLAESSRFQIACLLGQRLGSQPASPPNPASTRMTAQSVKDDLPV